MNLPPLRPATALLAQGAIAAELDAICEAHHSEQNGCAEAQALVYRVIRARVCAVHFRLLADGVMGGRFPLARG